MLVTLKPTEIANVLEVCTGVIEDGRGFIRVVFEGDER